MGTRRTLIPLLPSLLLLPLLFLLLLSLMLTRLHLLPFLPLFLPPLAKQYPRPAGESLLLPLLLFMFLPHLGQHLELLVRGVGYEPTGTAVFSRDKYSPLGTVSDKRLFTLEGTSDAQA